MAATTSIQQKFNSISAIIGKTEKGPTIVNPASQFVVATYWWGRNNQNKNIARPCVGDYEEILKIPRTVFEKNTVYMVYAAIKKKMEEEGRDAATIAEALFKTIRAAPAYRDLLEKHTSHYINSLKGAGVTPRDPRLLDKTYLAEGFTEMLRLLTQMNAEKYNQLLELYGKRKTITETLKSIQEEIQKEQADLQAARQSGQDMTAMEAAVRAARDARKPRVQAILQESERDFKQPHARILNAFRADYRTQGTAVGAAFADLLTEAPASVIEALERIFQYVLPVTYDAMIENWERKCAENNCNYLSVEYPEFAAPGGYQLAINAKPIFIRKALELCKVEGKQYGVLYIDGDMTINKYPTIFDMPDVDYMARGWNMDPRGNERFLEGDFMYDPYNFETSGGTMYFGPTVEAERLLDLWIDYSFRPINEGKADDRIISLLLNTKRLLGPLKVLQLPVEYLWLTMWYNDYLPFTPETIYIEHPECLTTEDTASGSGAASDRTPEFYDLIAAEISQNRSEELYETVMFEESRFAECLRPWMQFMADLEYAQPDLEGEAPLYISPLGQFGSRQAIYQRNMAAFDYPNIQTQLGPTRNVGETADERLVVRDQMSAVPRIVHQIWFGGEMPAYKKALTDAVRKAAQCAGWTYKLWTTDEFTEKQFPCVWEGCMKAKAAMEAGTQSRWAQIADLCRYELLNRFGGVYLDSNFVVDARLFQEVERLNAKGSQVILCNEDPCGMDCMGAKGRRYISNSFIAGVRHHPVFGELISDAMLEDIDFASPYVNRTTGPYYLRRAMDVLDGDYSEIAMLAPEKMYPVPMSGSKRATTEPLPNPFLAAAGAEAKGVPTPDGRSLVLDGWEAVFPESLGVYMVGLGGSWSFDEDEDDEEASA